MKILLLFGFLLHVSQHARAGVVEAIEGMESVSLPCSYYSGVTEEPLLKWTSGDFIPNAVHLRRGEQDDLKNQNQHFRGRTSMEPDALETRDFSLTLKKPNISDNGNYTCSFYTGREEFIMTTIHLKVKGDQEEVKLTGGAESVVLPCRTSLKLHEKTSVHWTRSEPEFNTVHVYSNQSKDQNKQDSLYRGRTKLNEDLLRTGDLSLTLSYPTERDGGTYICTVYRDEDILRWKVVLKHVRETFPSWATALLVLLVLLIISAGLLYRFRHRFISGEEGMERMALLQKQRLAEDLCCPPQRGWLDPDSVQNNLLQFNLNLNLV
ncbi:myelin-oligodendrocyte glycoprotein-like isoform X1 [Fundulus heteroclitus]|uniref:myelin-oligodendrocyte glycoprotein-like isoform X1 n=1 Tax=Fundulus heteroclitus TaxID=8078 RepID=UPI00165B3389|nr:myelin-oligodendrocyte glycoprotein-like isoform X1 [Fundulus heteroclitus]